MYKCIVCEKEVDDYEPQMCCGGVDCGCRGLPIEPPLCDDHSVSFYNPNEVAHVEQTPNC